MVASIHPFPARMAPELAYRSLSGLPAGSRVLDPMCGSGTVLRTAVEAGLTCSGVDLDPLAVLMSRVWTTPVDIETLEKTACEVVGEAKALDVDVDASSTDSEASEYIAYWFAPAQRSALARLAKALPRDGNGVSDALAVALSRIIVTKEMVASLARDTSHSRPHRVAEVNDFDVYDGFIRSAKQLAKRLRPGLIRASAVVRRGDARALGHMADESFDLAITSPPYLNAIDYLRGHRLSLIWLGHTLDALRQTRAASIGAERSMQAGQGTVDISTYVVAGSEAAITDRHLGWIRRYASDMESALRELRRVVRPDGGVVLVLGNSFLRGATVDNVRLVQDLAEVVGLRLDRQEVREIPSRRRYLPPPGDQNGALDGRMRKEAILTLKVA